MRDYKKYFLFIAIVIILIISCRKDNYKLYIVFDNAYGLSSKTEVITKGIKIGSVDRVDLFKNKVLATVTIDKTIQIPITSTFMLQSVDIFGQKAIFITLDSTISKNYVDKDTVCGKIQKSFFSDSTKFNDIKPLIDTLVNVIITSSNL
jgi:ABC-type transporter Mla subunit MlaD